MTTETVAIDLPEDHDGIQANGAIRLLESFGGAADDELRERTMQVARRAMRDFPELAHETVTIARLNTEDRDGVNARADMLNRIVFLPTDRPTSFMTMYHELAHLAIQVRDERGEGVSASSEDYCSIVAVARMDGAVIDRDTIAYLGAPSAPQAEWPTICQRALDYRAERGKHSHYIQQCKEWLGIGDSS